MLGVITLSVSMMRVVMLELRYAEYHYVECCYAKVLLY
jgi:hypothetical protein